MRLFILLFYGLKHNFKTFIKHFLLCNKSNSNIAKNLKILPQFVSMLDSNK